MATLKSLEVGCSKQGCAHRATVAVTGQVDLTDQHPAGEVTAPFCWQHGQAALKDAAKLERELGVATS